MQEKKFYQVPLYNVINYKGEFSFVDFIVVTKTFLGAEEIVTKTFLSKVKQHYHNHIDTKYLDCYQLAYYGSQLVVFAKDLNQRHEVGRKEVEAWIASYPTSPFQIIFEKREKEREKIFQKIR